MNKELAKEFAKLAQTNSEWFNAMTKLTIRLESEDLDYAKRIRSALGSGFLDLDEILVRPLRNEHPEFFSWFKD